jgi:alkanesulfonate monooxygenase SsuD/methylene tetrahydromethanopterin reductase-like flavin-dependent oxidoreductase (luciferase family)
MSKPTIGLVAFWKNYDRKQTLRAAQLADELGYDSFWIPEAWGYDFVPLLTEIALNTKNIRIGTGIMNVWSRSPGLIGMTTATLDELSEGRFVLGIGTSGKRVIEGFHGRTFDQPLTQVRDVIRVVRALLAGQRISDAGAKRTEYRPFKLEMQPVRKTVPIYVAALKEQSLRSIGEMADGWIPTFWPTDRLGEGRKWIEEGAAKAGRSASEIVTAPFTSVLPIAGAAGEAQAKDIVAFYIGGMGEYYKELLVSFGFAAECDRVEALYKDPKTRTQARDAVSDAMVNALMIQGDPAHCVEELARRRSMGLDLPILNLPYGVPDQVVETFIKLLAPRG